MTQKTYRCEECEHEITQDAALPAPDCCGDSMKALPPCEKSHNAESARLADSDEACDDGIM
ncbi:MAG: hypothetical protein E4H20_02285 [Spirochaetales bacterium]|nr:MAG: hypothetical protein E4H20_02285 [Spirochaetales bacterium]